MNKVGVIASATFGVGMRIDDLCNKVSQGLQFAASPMIGQNIAAGQTPTSQTAKAQEKEDDIQNLGEPCPTQTVQLPILHGYSSSSRGVGLADMCYALLNGRKPRCHYDIGLHAIEVISHIADQTMYAFRKRIFALAPIEHI